MKRQVLVTVVATALVGGLVTACGPGQTKAAPQPTQPITPITLAISPASAATGVPIAAEIGTTVSGGTITSVALTKAGDATPLTGDERPDGSSWVPAKPLAYNTAYTAQVTAVSEAGEQTVAQTSFTTMAQPGSTIGTGLYLFDGETVGVATPITIQFNTPVAAGDRAAVQQRLFVDTDPPQQGVWSWADDGRQVFYRAPTYWQTGTKISVRSALAGAPIGDSYGDTDRTATVTVGDKIFMDVDNKSKQMYVYVNDQFVKAMPVSLGKPSTPSSSGFMVTMSHEANTIFDTRGQPNGGYVIPIQNAMRLTWGGEYIHDAPWSVGSQGHTNVSHGCVNLSDANSKWLFGLTHVGDPVIVRGTERTLENGNGWTAWNIPWSQYVQGSALPVPDDLANAPAVDNVTGALPTAAASSPSQADPNQAAQAGSTPTPVPAAT